MTAPRNRVTWASFSLATRQELLARYEIGDKLEDVAEALGMNPITLQRQVRQHRENLRTILDGAAEENAKLVDSVIEATRKHNDDIFPPDGKNLTDIVFADSSTDQAKWVRTLQDFASQKQRVTVMHLHDIHAPFQNDQALEVAYQLVRHVKPDVIVGGSDAADFALLSGFQHDPDEEEENSDELDTFKSFWYGHVRTLRDIVPNTPIVYIYGNHEVRIFRYLTENAKKLRRTVLKAFTDIVRCDNNVLYMGDKVDSVRIGPLLVMHGNRYGVNPAKAILQDVGGQVWVQFGHNHRISEHYINGEIRRVGAVGSGCLCSPPHYLMGRPRTKEQLGTSVSFVDLETGDVQIDNLIFTEEWNGRVHVAYERKLFESNVPARL